MAATGQDADLASAITRARLAADLSQVELARRAGIAPSYMSRIEGAAWKSGGPWPSDQVLRSLARVLGLSSTALISMRTEARLATGTSSRRPKGWSGPGYTVCTDNDGVYESARRLVDRNPPRQAIRTTSVRMLLGAEGPPTERQIDFQQALADHLAGDLGSTLYRVCTSSADNLELVKENTERLAGGRDPSEVRNIRSRFCFGNPLILDFIIGANEALIAIPDRRGHPHLRACLVVDDPDFVTAMQDWYDEFIWDPSSDWVEVRYDQMDEALEQIEARLRAEREIAEDPATPPG
ncbi:MAG: Helix-turn-helix domain [Actinomycetota bacterium]|nr:Helix-turn-helix domain [Actinomycetota bacterium]MEA2844301.1 Helix-turn-helix domain [Actinomycetota bacterium]